MKPPIDLSTLSSAQKDALILQLFEMVTSLQQQVKELQEFDEQSRALVCASNVVHFDETGMRVGKQLDWVHVASTESVTCYMHHPNRGTPALEAMGILEGFNGYAVHDHWASYFRFAILHVLCGAHILRELIHAHEQHEQAWAQKLIICLLDAKQEVDLAIAEGAKALNSSRIDYYDDGIVESCKKVERSFRRYPFLRRKKVAEPNSTRSKPARLPVYTQGRGAGVRL